MVALLSLLLTISACASDDAKTPSGPLYRTNATVLETESRGPMLCLGGMLASDVPQCGTVPITNWDWKAVTGEETNGAATWGEFYVVGTFDGTAVTLVEAGPVRPFGEDEPPAYYETPACGPPAGGWKVPDHGRTTDAQVSRAGNWAERRPQYVASWVTYLEDPSEVFDPGVLPVVLSIVVDRDAALIRAGARKRWDGALCVVERDLPTYGAAAAIRKDAERAVEELGLHMVGSQSGEVGEAAVIDVVADPGGKVQAALDELFGPGVIRLVPWLVPVE